MKSRTRASVAIPDSGSRPSPHPSASNYSKRCKSRQQLRYRPSRNLPFRNTPSGLQAIDRLWVVKPTKKERNNVVRSQAGPQNAGDILGAAGCTSSGAIAIAGSFGHKEVVAHFRHVHGDALDGVPKVESIDYRE